MAERYFYEIMFLDCQMPGMDGFEATERIRQSQSTTGAYVPIIAMTANAMGGDREKCLSVGMDDFLAKPVTEEQLGSMVQHWLGRASPAAS
jgi:CheY-like chemotaxis protein